MVSCHVATVCHQMPLDTHKRGKDQHGESWGGIGCAGRMGQGTRLEEQVLSLFAGSRITLAIGTPSPSFISAKSLL